MSSPDAGSLVFCHSSGIIGKAIRLGEELRFRSGDFYNHVGIIDLDGTVIQAEAHGVTAGAPLESIAPGGSYEIIKIPDVNPIQVVEFARGEVGTEYGYLSIVSTGMKIIAPRSLPLPDIRTESSWICSALAAESIRVGGWYHRWPDIYQVVPSELYAAIKGVDVRNAYLESLRESVRRYGRTNTQAAIN